MKNTFVIAALLGATSAIQVSGINGDKMHHNGDAAIDGRTNWRKPWP
tara:strand:- start:415 stop:555 length:141 start_codon:yes stop_codon:yes gene_type:complete